VSQAAVVGHPIGVDPAESPLTPESWGKLGMWIFLAADAMSFGGLLAGYAALRLGDPSWPKPSDVLGINLTAVMTFILICSSVSMVKALSAIRHGNHSAFRLWLAATAVGGMFFLGCQAYEWTHLIDHGLSLGTLFGATFFVLTGFHGAHVTSGVIYLLVILALAGRFDEDHNNPVELVGLYWHFVDLVWILIFTFVYLL
jgi:heme/copper-type cytochrome/quinol oxidase subunit 3